MPEQKWCGNCKFAEIKKEEITLLVKIKCIVVLPMWVKLGWSIGDEPDEDELREYSFYSDLDKNPKTYGSDCLCHKLKEE